MELINNYERVNSFEQPTGGVEKKTLPDSSTDETILLPVNENDYYIKNIIESGPLKCC